MMGAIRKKNRLSYQKKKKKPSVQILKNWNGMIQRCRINFWIVMYQSADTVVLTMNNRILWWVPYLVIITSVTYPLNSHILWCFILYSYSALYYILVVWIRAICSLIICEKQFMTYLFNQKFFNKQKCGKKSYILLMLLFESSFVWTIFHAGYFYEVKDKLYCLHNFI